MIKRFSPERLIAKIVNFLCSYPFHLFLIGIGIGLRFNQYLINHPLGLDETYVAIQTLARTWEEIFSFYRHPNTQPLAPLYFYVLVKSLVLLLGNNEYVLRLSSFVCSMGSVLLFYRILRKYFDKGVVTLALAFFVLADSLIRFAGIVKYYSLDVFVSLTLIYFCEKYLWQREIKPKTWLWWGVLGSMAIWTSYGSIFILTGIGLVLFFKNRHEARQRLFVVGMGMMWFLNFFILSKASLRFMTSSQRLLQMWDDYKHAFLPASATFLTFIIWVKDAVLNMFVNPGGMLFPVLGLIIFIVGLIVVFFKNRTRFYFYLSWFLLLLTMAALRKFPFYGRMLLFFIPIVYIVIAEGLVFLIKQRPPWGTGVAAGIIMVLLANPLYKAGYHLTHNRYQDCSNSNFLLKIFKEKYVPGDFIFINNYAFFPICYYGQQLNIFHLMPKKAIYLNRGGWGIFYTIEMARFATSLIPENLQVPVMEFDRLLFLMNPKGFYRGALMKSLHYVSDETRYFFPKKRTWLLLIDTPRNEADFILSFFKNNGVLIDSFVHKGDGIYLFEKREK